MWAQVARHRPATNGKGAAPDDGFTEVKRKTKPKPVVVSQIQEGPLCPPSPDAIYHPDFAVTRSPSDVLFRTKDGSLFWFSLSLLVHHAPDIALIELNYTLPAPIAVAGWESVIQLLHTDSDVFALVAHTLLLDYHTRQRALMLETPRETIVPPSLVRHGAYLLTVIDGALCFAKVHGIQSFRGMLLRLMADYAGSLLDTGEYEHYDLGSQIMDRLER